MVYRSPAGEEVDLDKWPTLLKNAYKSKKEYRKRLNGQVGGIERGAGQADIAREGQELATESARETAELAGIYVQHDLDSELAQHTSLIFLVVLGGLEVYSGGAPTTPGVARVTF